MKLVKIDERGRRRARHNEWIVDKFINTVSKSGMAIREIEPKLCVNMPILKKEIEYARFIKKKKNSEICHAWFLICLSQLSKEMPGQISEMKNNTDGHTHTHNANTLRVALDSNSYDLKLIENIFSRWLVRIAVSYRVADIRSVACLRYDSSKHPITHFNFKYYIYRSIWFFLLYAYSHIFTYSTNIFIHSS